MNTIKFEDALIIGRNWKQRIIDQVNRVVEWDNKAAFPHLYLYGPPGIGKTFTVKSILENSDKLHFTVSGNVSLFAFGIQLAVIRHALGRDNVIIVIDDCDELLKNAANLNTIKNVLEGQRELTYNKSLTSQIKDLPTDQANAIEALRRVGQMGFSVPCDTMRFIFTSNIPLPTDDDVSLARKRNSLSKATLLSHQCAIRSRCNVLDLSLNDKDMYSIIVHTSMESDLLPLMTSEKRGYIFDFLQENWESLKERSLRTVIKMNDIMNQYPSNFWDIWSMDFLKMNNTGNGHSKRA
jgi:hypothetical protein